MSNVSVTAFVTSGRHVVRVIGWVMVEFVSGILLLVLWVILQFVVQPATGFIHIALAAGVILVIRGIAVSKWGTPGSR
jgi:ABC-type amino acid transport system permease subunit